MDADPSSLVKILLPRLPLIIRTAVFNVLSLSENSSKQSVGTETTVAVIRSLLEKKMPLGKIQSFSLKDPGIKGKMWISKVTIPVDQNEHGPRDVVIKGIQELGDGTGSYQIPELSEVEGEWTGYREGVTEKEPRLDASEADHYTHLMKEVSSPVTVLYFHGGGYFLMDPSSHRGATSQIAKLIKGRCFSVRYRLAPQNPFPAQLLDALISYLYLLAPPKGALHDPIPANLIVFSGDSAGGNLSLALILLILTLRRSGLTSIKFHGKDVPLDLPAGCAVQSPWCDISMSLPSFHQNAHFDYLSPPKPGSVPQEDHIPDSIWPTTPPRAEIFCESSILMHPLVSPVMAKSELWKGAPPIFMCLGNETLEDEICVLARNVQRSGSIVHLVGYEGMPHCFAMIFVKTPAGKDCFSRLTQFMTDAVAGNVSRAEHAQWMKAHSNPLEFYDVPWESASALTNEQVKDLMTTKQQDCKRREDEMLRNLNQPQPRSHL